MTDKDGNTESETSELTGTWKSFELNIYYDSNTQKSIYLLAIQTLFQVMLVGNQNSLPREGEIGNGNVNTSVTSRMEPTIMGFVKAYAKVTQEKSC